MHCLSSSSRLLLYFMASAPLRWRPSAIARRLMAAPNPPVHRVFRIPLGLQNMTSISGKPYTISSGKTLITSQGNEPSVQGIKNIEMKNLEKMANNETRSTISGVIDEDERGDNDACRTTSEVIDGKRDTLGQNVNSTDCEQRIGLILVSEAEGFPVNGILAESRHRDGSIYNRGLDFPWKKDYCIADRNETWVEAMMLSDPTNCIIIDGDCNSHLPTTMLQIFSVKLAKALEGGFVKLYGYIATRDGVDPLLNYIVNISRDDPIIVKQGSLIHMAGPKRGISHMKDTMIEYDMKIKTGEQEKDDLQLIDGVTAIGWVGEYETPLIYPIPINKPAVEITLARLNWAIEATVEVLISKVQSSFNLSLDCLTSGLNEEIRLFDGAITESRGLKRSVVAVTWGSWIDLKFKVGSSSSIYEQRCSSKTIIHGHDLQEMKTDFALISVKVVWSSLPNFFSLDQM